MEQRHYLYSYINFQVKSKQAFLGRALCFVSSLKASECRWFLRDSRGIPPLREAVVTPASLCPCSCCPRQGRDPHGDPAGGSQAEQAAAHSSLLELCWGSHTGPSVLPRAFLVQIPKKCIPFMGWLVERGHEVLKLSQGKWQRTFAGTQCYKDGTSLKTSDQPERAEREKQRKAQTLPCLWQAQSSQSSF